VVGVLDFLWAKHDSDASKGMANALQMPELIHSKSLDFQETPLKRTDVRRLNIETQETILMNALKIGVDMDATTWIIMFKMEFTV
jgi:hypothetical protein